MFSDSLFGGMENAHLFHLLADTAREDVDSSVTERGRESACMRGEQGDTILCRYITTWDMQYITAKNGH